LGYGKATPVVFWNISTEKKGLVVKCLELLELRFYSNVTWT